MASKAKIEKAGGSVSAPESKEAKATKTSAAKEEKPAAAAEEAAPEAA